ncbi:MAG TPA: hypothetical protein VJL54_01945 [Nitrososphaera sp.]|nr:hypothetical protein [Nitrososphaera sp.]
MLLILGALAAGMQAAFDSTRSAPTCGGCGSSERVAPSMHEYRGEFFCTSCCNYLDGSGTIKA